MPGIRVKYIEVRPRFTGDWEVYAEYVYLRDGRPSATYVCATINELIQLLDDLGALALLGDDDVL